MKCPECQRELTNVGDFWICPEHGQIKLPDNASALNEGVAKSEGEDQTRLFISYGRRDAAEFAQKLANWLKSQGYEPWLDVDNGIPLGSPFDHRIEIGIRGSDFLLAILSPWSLRPEGFCRNELLFAQANGVPIIPVRIADVLPPIQIISLNYLDVAKNPDEAFSKLPGLLKEIESSLHVGYRDWPTNESAAPWWAQLPTLDFTEEFVRHGATFIGRDWLFAKLRQWTTKRESRTLLITGDAGLGKSAIAAQMTARLNVKGVHFCSRSNMESSRLSSWVGGLVYQLAAQLPAYKEELAKLPPPKWNKSASLIRKLIVDPLRRCETKLLITDPWVFVIDGLDEAVASSGNELAETLADPDISLPDWFRLIVTCRPDASLLAMFQIDGVQQNQLDAEGEDNQRDIELYVSERLLSLSHSVAPQSLQRNLLNKIVQIAGGNFLFAKMTIDALCDPDPETRLNPQEVGTLPGRLGGLYHAMFRKRFRNLDRYERELLPLIECLVAAPPAVLPKEVLLMAGGPDERSARKGLRTLSQFLQHTRNGVALFHKSLSDWLSDSSSSAEFSVLPGHGHQVLADYCWQQYRAGVDNMSEYSVRYAQHHLAEASRTEELHAITKDSEFLHRCYELRLAELGADLAPYVHSFYVNMGRNEGWVSKEADQDFDDLADEIRRDTFAAAERIPRVLELIGLYVVPSTDPNRISASEYKTFLESHGELLAEAEHDGWMEVRQRNGWKYGETRDDDRKIHPAIVRYTQLSEHDKRKDRNSVATYLEILKWASFGISTSPAVS